MSYYFPLQSSSIQSLIVFEDGIYSYHSLQIKENYFPWADGFYLWSFLTDREYVDRVLLALNYEFNGDTYFLVDEGKWDEDFYGFNFDKDFLEKIGFAKLPQLEHQETPYGHKFNIKMPEEGFYNIEEKKIIKGIVLLGSYEFKSYSASDYFPIKYIPYNGEDNVEVICPELPYPVITYSLILDNFVSQDIQEYPVLPMVAKPIIFSNFSKFLTLKSKISLKRREGLYLTALSEDGFANLEWKYNDDINNKVFAISGGFDGEYYYPIAEIRAENYSYYDGNYYYYSFTHFLGERSAGIFYIVELRDNSGDIKQISWTRSRQK